MLPLRHDAPSSPYYQDSGFMAICFDGAHTHRVGIFVPERVANAVHDHGQG